MRSPLTRQRILLRTMLLGHDDEYERRHLHDHLIFNAKDAEIDFKCGTLCNSKRSGVETFSESLS